MSVPHGWTEPWFFPICPTSFLLLLSIIPSFSSLCSSDWSSLLYLLRPHCPLINFYRLFKVLRPLALFLNLWLVLDPAWSHQPQDGTFAISPFKTHPYCIVSSPLWHLFLFYPSWDILSGVPAHVRNANVLMGPLLLPCRGPFTSLSGGEQRHGAGWKLRQEADHAASVRQWPGQRTWRAHLSGHQTAKPGSTRACHQPRYKSFSCLQNVNKYSNWQEWQWRRKNGCLYQVTF